MRAHLTSLKRTGLLLALSISGVFGSACASLGPQVNVIGVSAPSTNADQSSLLMFVEVTNPTQVNLELSRFQYQLEAIDRFSTSGDVSLSRPLNPGGTAVVEVPVKVNPTATAALSGVPYTLTGRIYAREDRLERSWKVSARGSLGTSASNPLRTRVAGSSDDSE
jgi:hypothetical protein